MRGRLWPSGMLGASNQEEMPGCVETGTPHVIHNQQIATLNRVLNRPILTAPSYSKLQYASYGLPTHNLAHRSSPVIANVNIAAALIYNMHLCPSPFSLSRNNRVADELRGLFCIIHNIPRHVFTK